MTKLCSRIMRYIFRQDLTEGDCPATCVGRFVTSEGANSENPQKKQFRSGMSTRLVIFAVLLLLSMRGTDSFAESPGSPRVKGIVAKAVGYLQKEGFKGGTFGTKQFSAYTLLKSGTDPENAETKQGIAEAVKEIKTVIKTRKPGPTQEAWSPIWSAYFPSVSVMFLCELDDKEYQSEIQWMLNALYQSQANDGSFGYSTVNNGDTSQTQYAILAFWYALRHGFEVPQANLQKSLNWFIRAQLPSGGYAYQYTRQGGHPHEPDKPTMGPAAMGSLYILNDLGGGIIERPKDVDTARGQLKRGLPDTVKEYKEKKLIEKKVQLEAKGLEAVLTKGDNWVAKHFKIGEGAWNLYGMYAYERMQAYSDLAYGNDQEQAAWYDKGVDLLEKSQSKDGGWGGAGDARFNNSQACFAILFLKRNSREAIASLEEGRLGGGGDLGMGKLRIGADGKITSINMTKSVDDLIGMSKDSSTQNWEEFRLSLDSLEISNEPRKREEQLEQLRYMVGHKAFQARILAVQQLAKRRDFKAIPDLIYALSDPDKRVAAAAHDSLRVMSRRFDLPSIDLDSGIKMTESDEKKLSQLRGNWKKWYLTIKPDAVFVN